MATTRNAMATTRNAMTVDSCTTADDGEQTTFDP